MRRYLFPGLLCAIALAYPLLTAGFPVYQRLGALVLLAAIGASAWNIDRRLCRPGLRRPCRLLRLRAPIPRSPSTPISACRRSPARRIGMR